METFNLVHLFKDTIIFLQPSEPIYTAKTQYDQIYYTYPQIINYISEFGWSITFCLHEIFLSNNLTRKALRLQTNVLLKISHNSKYYFISQQPFFFSIFTFHVF